MNYLAKNLELLEKCDIHLYKRAQNWLDSEKDSEFSVVEAKNGQPTLQYTSGDKIKFLTSAYNPSDEGQKWFEKIPVKDFYIVYGLGLAYHLQGFVERKPKIVVVIEPNKEVFLLALKFRDLSWLFQSKMFFLSIAEDVNILRLRFKQAFLAFYSYFDFACLSSYKTVFAEDYQLTEKLLEESIINFMIDVNTVTFFGKQWTENTLENLYPSVTNPGVINLFDQFKNVPIVLVAAGPSLNKNVHLLKELKGKALILCVGTAYKVLKNNGIKPDLVVSIDGSHKNYEIFQGLNIEDIPLVYEPTINHQIIKEYKGPLIPCNIRNDLANWFERRLGISLGGLLMGSSVANIAFDLARKMGGDPIIFVGQDLAYTGGSSHAKGTIYENEKKEATGHFLEVWVDGIDGQQVLSNRSFVIFRRWFEGQIEKNPDRNYINATEGGANIKGTVVMQLADVINQYCQIEHPIIENFHTLLRTERPKEEIVAETLELLKVIKDELLKFNKRSKKGLKLAEELRELFKRPEANHGRIQKILRDLDKIDAEIMKYQNGKVFLQVVFQPLIVPLLGGPYSREYPGETEEEARARIINFNQILYDGLYEISTIVLEIVEKVECNFMEKLTICHGGV